MTDNGTAHKGLYPAVLAVQRAVKTLPRDAVNPFFKSKYTPLDTIVETLKPLLADAQLVFMSFPCRDTDGNPALRYRIVHAPTGEMVEAIMPLLNTDNSPQGLGSALTYARRYCLCAVLNLVTDDDVDGQQQPAAAQTKPAKAKYGTAPAPSQGATDAQRKRIHVLLKETSTTRDELARMIEPWGVELGEGWLDRLTAGREGTASVLIELLQERRLKKQT